MAALGSEPRMLLIKAEIMHLSVLVVDGHILLDGGGNGGIVNDNRGVTALGVHHQLQYIEEFACIAPAVTHQGFAFPHLDFLFLQEYILLKCPFK